MAKAFSVASWNVKHFHDDPDRIDRVLGFLKEQNPDVIGLYEVTGKEVYKSITQLFPQFIFQITFIVVVSSEWYTTGATGIGVSVIV